MSSWGKNRRPPIVRAPNRYVLTVRAYEGDPARDSKIQGAAVVWDGLEPGEGVTDGSGNFTLPPLPPHGFNVTISGGQTDPPMRGTFGEHWRGVGLGRDQTVDFVLPFDPTPVPVIVPRRGLVGLDGHVFRDDDGRYLAVGTSLFWAGWGYLHDRQRLEDKNLAGLHAAGIDYIRVAGVLGGRGGDPTLVDSYHDRIVDPRDPRWTEMIAGLTDLAYDVYGLRVQWTLLMDDPAVPHDVVVGAFVAMSHGREHKIQHWEVCNEGNGFHGNHAGMKALARRLRAETPNVVAVTAPSTFDAAPEYADSTANLLTWHTDRETFGGSEMWRPVRSARAVLELPNWSGAWSSNEPIGPQSSGSHDVDPLRLTMAAVYTWICKGAAYVLHCGAGIRGGGAWEQRPDRIGLGIPPNLPETSNFSAICAGLRMVRTILPRDLPNFTWANSSIAAGGGHLFDVQEFQDGKVLRAMAGVAGDGRFVVAPIVAPSPVTLRAKHAMRFELIDPMTGTVMSAHQLFTGQIGRMPAAEATIIVGQLT